MDHHDHVNLLREGIPGSGGVWADFGSGSGAFTLALADLIGQGGEIYSLDKNRRALGQQKRDIQARFPQRDPECTHYLVADFTRPMALPPLDGVVMANALHFTRKKDRVLDLILSYLKPGGRFILVEYNINRGNPWVPHPIPYPAWERLAGRIGFVATRRLAARPSRTFGQIYSSLSLKPKEPR